MPAYRSSRCDLKTCTFFRAMIERRTLRMSSSLFPLNITPAMTSIHPPLWWKGPLGPLTTGRGLCADHRGWGVSDRTNLHALHDRSLCLDLRAPHDRNPCDHFDRGGPSVERRALRG